MEPLRSKISLLQLVGELWPGWLTYLPLTIVRRSACVASFCLIHTPQNLCKIIHYILSLVGLASPSTGEPHHMKFHGHGWSHPDLSPGINSYNSTKSSVVTRVIFGIAKCTWAKSQCKDRLSQVWDSMLNIRRLIFNMAIPILKRRHLYIETVPWSLWEKCFRISHDILFARCCIMVFYVFNYRHIAHIFSWHKQYVRIYVL